MNPLLNITFRVPFDQIQASQVEPAIDELLADANRRLGETIASVEPLHALDTMTERLEYAMNVVRHLESVATTPELRAAFNAVQPKVSVFYSSLPLNEDLWNAIKRYAATAEAKSLTGAMKRYQAKTIDSFKRHGADLPPAGKARLKEIDVALTEATTKFSENVLDSTNAYELVLTDESTLAGLPPAAIAAARASAESKGKPGWRFTLHGPSYLALMTYLDDGPIREQVWRAYNLRGAEAPFDNRGLLKKILELRREKAVLLGFRDFADLVLEDRMAHTGDTAQKFLDDLRVRTEPRFKEENAALEKFAGKALEPWDVGYWAEKQRAALYDFDEEALRPYFSLNNVVAGMFEIFGRIFGIRVEQETGVPVWDAEVKCYAVYDSSSGANLGSFYADWYPRENKRGGAWMDSLITGNPSERHPHLGLICGNLTPPVEGKPALLTHREAETIFHEFGHLLHHLLSRVEVRSLAGTSVPWDFVELPSQIMENWAFEPEVLRRYARHWKTGELISAAMVEKIERAKRFNQGFKTTEYLAASLLDLEWHTLPDVAEPNAEVLERIAVARMGIPPQIVPRYRSTYFQHIFNSGYSAGYYSYIWAEVLDADAFQAFKEKGLFDPATARSFRTNILEKGYSEEPMVLYQRFRGRPPEVEPLLDRRGLKP